MATQAMADEGRSFSVGTVLGRAFGTLGSNPVATFEKRTVKGRGRILPADLVAGFLADRQIRRQAVVFVDFVHSCRVHGFILC